MEEKLTVRFLRDTNEQREGAAFAAGHVEELSEASAKRWVRRSAAEIVPHGTKPDAFAKKEDLPSDAVLNVADANLQQLEKLSGENLVGPGDVVGENGSGAGNGAVVDTPPSTVAQSIESTGRSVPTHVGKTTDRVAPAKPAAKSTGKSGGSRGK